MSDRKYRQRGYQDSGRPADRGEREGSGESGAPRERPAGRPDPREKPRGRGLGAPTAEVFRCARCGREEAVGVAMAADGRCAQCGSDLHTCTNCAAFDTGAPFECRKPVPARVSPKDRGNRCDLFEPRLRAEFAREKPAEERPSDARAAFDALFKF